MLMGDSPRQAAMSLLTVLVLGGVWPLVSLPPARVFAPVRRVGLGPDYPEYPVRAGELLAARRTRHVALACLELFQQVTGLIELAERRGIPTRVSALAVAQDEVRAHVRQAREGTLPPLRALVRKERGPAAQVRGMPKHVGVREAHASILVRHQEPVVVHLFRQHEACGRGA